MREYGRAAIAVYTTLYVVPGAAVFGVCYACDNFGFDHAAMLNQVGLKDRFHDLFSLPADWRPERWQTSLLFGFAATDMLDIARWPATFWLAPKVKRWWTSRGTGTGTGGGAATSAADAASANANVPSTAAADPNVNINVPHKGQHAVEHTGASASARQTQPLQ